MKIQIQKASKMNRNTVSKDHSHRSRAAAIQHLFVIVVIACGLIMAYQLKAAPEIPNKKSAEDNKSKRLSTEEISNIWTKIRTAKIPKSPEIKEGSSEAWLDVMCIGFAEMKKIVMSSNPREGLDFFINQFGKHGVQADMRWLLAMRTWGLAPNRSLNPHQERKDSKLRSVQLIFAELQVRQFLKSPKLLDRYYHSVIWFNNYFADINFPVYMGNVYRNMKEGSESDYYWWHAHQFILMAHATGRDDLLKDVKPEDLKPRFQQWFEWFRKNGMYLRASPNSFYWVLDEGEKERQEGYVPFVLKQTLPPLKLLPSYPFPEWKGPKPTTPQNYWSME